MVKFSHFLIPPVGLIPRRLRRGKAFTVFHTSRACPEVFFDFRKEEMVPGQGALLHPSYAGVSLGLLHGSQPDAVVLCHEVGRDDLIGLEGIFEVPPLDEAIDIVLTSARVTNPDCIWAGISVNASLLDDEQRRGYLADLGGKYGLPCVDPIATGVADIADFLLENVQ